MGILYAMISLLFILCYRWNRKRRFLITIGSAMLILVPFIGIALLPVHDGLWFDKILLGQGPTFFSDSVLMAVITLIGIGVLREGRLSEVGS
ncbi:MAG: hypothetical protein MUC62_10295, partial [Candidatus Thermoplasmatota archaeon]|nr:hypothetical protein [Candidatus Thermoplasmatota archaeon]